MSLVIPSRPTWPEHAMNIAHASALRSEDPFVKVGACLMRPDHTIASVGYNGAVSGVELDWHDREARRRYVIHAEANAFRWVTPSEVRGGILASTHHSCPECLRLAAAYGVKVAYYAEALDPSTYPPELLADVARVCGIEIRRLAV